MNNKRPSTGKILICLGLALAFFSGGCGLFRRSVQGPETPGREVMKAGDVELPETSLKEREWEKLTQDEKKKRNRAVEMANRGNKNLKEGKNKEAIRDFLNALKEWPDLADAFLGLGNAYYKEARYDGAVGAMDDYIKYNAKKPEPHFIKGLCHRKLEEKENALKSFLLVTKLDPGYAAAYLEIAHIYYEEEAFKDAMKNYQKALDLDRSLSEAYLGRGNIYIRLKDYEKAVLTLDEGLKISQEKRLADARKMAEGLLLLREGKKPFEDKKYREALEKFRRAGELIGDHYELYFLTGQACLFTGENEEAEKYLTRALKIQSDDAGLYLTLVDLCRKKKKYREAVAYLEEAAAKWPENYKIHNFAGMVYNETESFSKAVESFQASVRLKPDYAEAHLNLGVAYYETERYREARDSFDRALKLSKRLEKAADFSRKSSAMILVQEGHGLFEKRSFGAAGEKYRQAAALAPEFPEILVSLGNACVESTNYSQAVLHYKKALEKDKNYMPALFGLERAYRNSGDLVNAQKINDLLGQMKGKDPGQYYRMGLSLEANRRYDEAIAEYRKALEADPGYRIARTRLAKAFYKKGVLLFNDQRYNEAREEFTAALRHHPSLFDARDKLDYLEALRFIGLAGRLYDQGDYLKAAENYEKALAVYKGAKEIFLNLANIHIIRKDYKKADRVLREGIRNFPRAGDFFQMLGMISMNQADYKAAYGYYSRSLELDPKNDAVLNDIGEIFLKSENYDEALKVFSGALAVNPKNFTAHINLGITHFRKGDYQKAAAEFEATKQLDSSYDPAYFNCGLAYYKLNDYARSENNFITAIRLNDGVPAFYFYLARTLYLAPGKIDEAVRYIEKALQMQASPLYYYGAGKIYEQKMLSALKMDVPKFLEKAIRAYRQVIETASGSQLAQWAQERLLALVPDVRLMNLYALSSQGRCAFDFQNGFIAAADAGGILYLFDTQARSTDVLRKRAVLGIPVTSDLRIRQNRIYAGLENGDFICLDMELRPLWTYRAEGAVTGAPVFDGERVYFGTGRGRMHAVSRNSGQLLWHFDTGSPIAGSPLLDKSALYFGNEEGEIFCLDQRGGLKWKQECTGRMKGDVSLCQAYLGAGTDRGLFYIFNRATGALVRKMSVEQSIESGVSSDRINFYFGAGSLLYSVYSGGKINWKFPVHSRIRSVPDIRGNLLVFSEEAGAVYAVYADSGKQKWRYSWNSSVVSRPVIVSQNNTLIGGADGSILELYYK